MAYTPDARVIIIFQDFYCYLLNAVVEVAAVHKSEGCLINFHDKIVFTKIVNLIFFELILRRRK